MPNKYKIELTVLDNYEDLGEEPYDVEDIKNDIQQTLEVNGVKIEGEIKVIKLE